MLSRQIWKFAVPVAPQRSASKIPTSRPPPLVPQRPSETALAPPPVPVRPTDIMTTLLDDSGDDVEEDELNRTYSFDEK